MRGSAVFQKETSLRGSGPILLCAGRGTFREGLHLTSESVFLAVKWEGDSCFLPYLLHV